MLQYGGFTTLGHSGQVIQVMPSKDMVVVFTAGVFNYWENMKYLTENYINRSVISDISIPDNPGKQAKMEAAVKKFANPEEVTNFDIPETARAISGKKFILDRNPWNIKGIILNFNGKDECFYEEDRFIDYRLKMKAGLDGKYRQNSFSTNINRRYLARGRWTGTNTFVLEYYMPWTYGCKIRYSMRFIGDTLEMINESASGKWKIELTGKME